MKSEILILSLIQQTQKIINQAEKLSTYDMHTLTWKENET